MSDMDAFDYALPAESVAQIPAEPRSAARLLDATSPGGQVRHMVVGQLPELLGPGDVLVVNDTRVEPARVRLARAGGGETELLLLEPLACGHGWWEALARPGRKLRPGMALYIDGREVAEVGERRGEEGGWAVRLTDESTVAGHAAIALPPYIRRPLDDPGRYQTVFARSPGSVAAPTAGLHFTTALLDECRQAGARVATVDLSVGMATFRPVTAARPEEHRMHTERYAVPAATMEACRSASRVVAVGTTTVRALESVAATGELRGRTSLFIHGHFDFRVTDVLMTNFHMPRSSLLLMLEAFCGGRWRELYSIALSSGYRFLSFGDAMLVAR